MAVRHLPCATLLFGFALYASDARPSYTIETVAGSSNLGDGGPAISAQFSTIKGITVDRWGNLFISDTGNNRVRKVTPDGVVTTVAGNGTPAFGGDGGPAAAASLNQPYGLATDWNGNLYVADCGNGRVRRIAADGTISTVAGNGSNGGPVGQTGPATQARLMSPRNLAIDRLGNLYISEFDGFRIRKVTTDGQISMAAGTGVMGFNGDGPALATEFSYPAGLAIDAGEGLLIADTQNGRLRRLANGAVTTVGGPALQGMPSGPALQGMPIGVAIDAAGAIYLAGGGTFLQEHPANGADQWIHAAGGTSGFLGDGGPATSAALTAVWDVAIDLQGNIYIADGMRVRRIDRQGIIQTVAGDGYRTALGDGHRATAAILYQPTAVTLDGSGGLYITDTGTNRVRRVAPDGTIGTFAGTGVAGQSPDWVPATQAYLPSPVGLAPGPGGSILIADQTDNRIRMVTFNGLISTFAGNGTPGRGPEGEPPAATDLQDPRGLCADRAGGVYIVDSMNERVLRVFAGAVTEIAGNGEGGYSGDGGEARFAQINLATACAVDTAGNLYLADTSNNRIRKVTADGLIHTIAGSGQPGYSGDEGPATAARLNAPSGIAVEDDGNVFLADTGNHRIRQITPDGVIHTIAGSGTAGYWGDGGPASGAQLYSPKGLVLDGAGNLYIADTGNNRVRRLLPKAAPPPAPVTAPPALSAVNAGSFAPGPIAPGEIVILTGTGLGPQTGVASMADASGLLPTQLGGSAVTFDGVPAPLLYAQYGQINVQAPYTLAGNGRTHIEVFSNGQSAGTLDLPVAPVNPALFPMIVNQDGSPNRSESPAPHGTVVAFFATGEGLTSGANISGLVAQPPYAQPQQPVSLTIGGIACELLFAAEAPGMAGELQINARVPGAFLPSGAAQAVLTVGTFSSPPVTIWVQ